MRIWEFDTTGPQSSPSLPHRPSTTRTPSPQSYRTLSSSFLLKFAPTNFRNSHHCEFVEKFAFMHPCEFWNPILLDHNRHHRLLIDLRQREPHHHSRICEFETSIVKVIGTSRQALSFARRYGRS